MKKITVINAYGVRNIGDSAIQTVCLRFIDDSLSEKALVTILCEDPNSFRVYTTFKKIKIVPKQVPYGYAITGVNAPPSYFTKLYRFLVITKKSLVTLYLYKYIKKSLPSSGFYSYIKAIEDADCIIGMGGGYFISKHGIKDYFGLILTLLPVYIAKMFNKNILFLPMSIGPFASNSHMSLISNALKGAKVMYREEISHEVIKKFNETDRIKSLYGPDLALFYRYKKKNSVQVKLNSDYVVLTAREWLPKKKQQFYEETLVKLIRELWTNYELKTIFLPMAFNPAEDDDNRVAYRMNKLINDNQKFEILHISNPDSAQEILANSRINICTRMHSMILSITTDSPFIPIGYGHKTLGILKLFKLENWYIDINEVDFEILFNKVVTLLKESEYKKFIEILKKSNKKLEKEKRLILREIQEITSNNTQAIL